MKRSCSLREEGIGGRATRPPLQQHRMNVGESPTLLSQSMAQAATASQMQRSVVSIETFGLIDDEPIKRADIAVRPKVKVVCFRNGSLLKRPLLGCRDRSRH